MFAIRAEGLAKQYTLAPQAAAATLRDDLATALASPLRTVGGLFRRTAGARFWALRDVSFEIGCGEIVGVIGRNGAGKSTLLKILSRITEPTEGRAIVRGRLASLLEVGTGFHPELSGRENIFLNATILGMTRREIKSKLDEIIAFAGVERFIDTPVKHYSSGMYVRLAFAVAAHVDADVLLVDEVLAVGDAEFQRRCLGRMGEVAKSGRTVLLVSHALETLGRLCRRSLWLDGGRVLDFGETSEIARRYLSGSASGSRQWIPDVAEDMAVAFEAVRVHDSTGGAGELWGNEGIRLVFVYRVQWRVNGRLAFLVRDSAGSVVFASASTDCEVALNHSLREGRYRAVCEIPGNFLAPGRYVVTVAAPREEGLDKVFEDILSFEVSMRGSLAARDGRSGVVMPLLAWATSEAT